MLARRTRRYRDRRSRRTMDYGHTLPPPPPPPPVVELRVTSVQAAPAGSPFCIWTFSEPIAVQGANVAGFRINGAAALMPIGFGENYVALRYIATVNPGQGWELTDTGGFVTAVSGHPVPVPQSGLTG